MDCDRSKNIINQNYLKVNQINEANLYCQNEYIRNDSFHSLTQTD